MKLFAKIVALFQAPPVPQVVPPLYSDAEFLEAVMQQARQKTSAEQAAHPAGSSSLQKAVN